MEELMDECDLDNYIGKADVTLNGQAFSKHKKIIGKSSYDKVSYVRTHNLITMIWEVAPTSRENCIFHICS